MILNICDNPDVLRTVKLVVTVIDILKIAVPIILILMIMADSIKALISNKDEPVGALAVKRMIIAALIFFIPTFISIIINAAGAKELGYSTCITNANSKYIASAYVKQAEKYVATANTTLARGDYNAAMVQVDALQDQSAKAKLKSELSAIQVKIEEKEKLDAQKQKDHIKEEIRKWALMGYGYYWPIDGSSKITCCFNSDDSIHKGVHGAVDIAVSDNTPVVATKSGTIKRIENGNLPSRGVNGDIIAETGCAAWGGCGNAVIIDHGDGTSSKYCHLYPGSIIVKEGDYVSMGQQIAGAGSSGCSTGTHLHFAIYINGEAIDPMTVTKPRNVSNPNKCR